MMLRLELLRDEAHSAGHGTLAYLIEIAMLEARRISDQARRDVEERHAGDRDLWRPIGMSMAAGQALQRLKVALTK